MLNPTVLRNLRRAPALLAALLAAAVCSAADRSGGISQTDARQLASLVPAKPAPKPAQWPPAPTAEEMDLMRQVRDIAVTLRAPCCPELNVAQHDSAVTIEMKARIKEMIQQGKSRREIVNFLVGKYGDVILPKSAGFDTALYVLPPVLAIVLLWAIWLHLRGRRKPAVLHLNDDRWGKDRKKAA